MKTQLSLSWPNFLLITVAAAYSFVFMEWLFTVTRPSFMDVLSFGEKIAIFLFSGALLAVLAALLALPLIAASFLPGLAKYRSGFIRLGSLAPAVILAGMGLLMLDNFLYTIFKVGIVTAEGVWRGMYGGIFLALVGIAWRWVVNALYHPNKFLVAEKSRKFILAVLPVIVCASLGLVLLSGQAGSVKAAVAGVQNGGERPHILLITGDGINADHMSVYGYERSTTPKLEKLAKTSLVAENAFTNCGNTTGSVISMYASKYPTQTRVLFRPDILNGVDAYQHLPGILKLLGYRTVQITAPYYIDAYTFNLLNGFDVANQRSFEEGSVRPLFGEYLPGNFSYFISESENRVVERLRHIFYIQQMENPYNLVTNPKFADDEQRLLLLFREIRQAGAPLFIHVHFMNTHGTFFEPQKRVYSTEASKDIAWDADGYDDSILQFDSYVGDLVSLLEKRDVLDRTILIVGSDHGQQYATTARIPLMIRFPKGQFSGRIKTNAQNIDIAPTVLDYLELAQPDWMLGSSLLQDLPSGRLVWGFASQTIVKDESDGTFSRDESLVRPPFYQFGAASLVVCQRWYRLDLNTQELTSGDVAGHTAPCPESDLLSPEQFIAALAEHLQVQGFDASSLDTNP